jgi:hypothetical protein
MRLEAVLFVVSLAAAVWLGTHPKPVDPCLKNCQMRSQQLGCRHPEKCAEQCTKVQKAVNCKKQLDRFMTCAFAQSAWVCGANGVPELGPHAHVCEAQRDQVMLCLTIAKGKL